jgi:hypothetical protein
MQELPANTRSELESRSVKIIRRMIVLQRQNCSLFVALGLMVSSHAVLTAQEKPVVHSGGSPAYTYDTRGTQLEGTLIERKVYGPPGYGETPTRDTRDTILILKLEQSISVKPAPHAKANSSASLDVAKDVREVQLFTDRSQKPSIQTLIGQGIVVTGTLNESITASQYTKVWLDVATISAK